MFVKIRVLKKTFYEMKSKLSIDTYNFRFLYLNFKLRSNFTNYLQIQDNLKQCKTDQIGFVKDLACIEQQRCFPYRLRLPVSIKNKYKI